MENEPRLLVQRRTWRQLWTARSARKNRKLAPWVPAFCPTA